MSKPGEWIPNQYSARENLQAIEFLKRMNEVVQGKFPGVVTIVQEFTAWPTVSRPTYLGGLGFNYALEVSFACYPATYTTV